VPAPCPFGRAKVGAARGAGRSGDMWPKICPGCVPVIRRATSPASPGCPVRRPRCRRDRPSRRRRHRAGRCFATRRSRMSAAKRDALCDLPPFSPLGEARLPGRGHDVTEIVRGEDVEFVLSSRNGKDERVTEGDSTVVRIDQCGASPLGHAPAPTTPSKYCRPRRRRKCRAGWAGAKPLRSVYWDLPQTR
jgi:hypothetical protein